MKIIRVYHQNQILIIIMGITNKIHLKKKININMVNYRIIKYIKMSYLIYLLSINKKLS